MTWTVIVKIDWITQGKWWTMGPVEWQTINCLSSLAWKLLLELEVLVLASDTSSHDTISCHFAVLPRNNENQCCHSAGGLTSDPNACFSLLTVSLNSCLLTTSLSPQLHPHQYSQFCLQAGGRVTHGNLVESTLAGSSST